MAYPIRKRKCPHCKTFFHLDYRNVTRQRFCSKPDCRQASKADSQRRWLEKPENLDYFKGLRACPARQAVAPGAPGLLAPQDPRGLEDA